MYYSKTVHTRSTVHMSEPAKFGVPPQNAFPHGYSVVPVEEVLDGVSYSIADSRFKVIIWKMTNVLFA